MNNSKNITAALLLLAIGLFACAPAPAKLQPLSWDLSAGNSLATFKWDKPDLEGYTLNDVELHIKLPNGLQFDGPAREVLLARQGNTLKSISIRSAPLTLEEAHAAGLAQAKSWGLDAKPIEQWLAERKAEATPDAKKQYRTISQTGNPELVVESLESPNATKPWIHSVSITWRD
jgi:hypothetical protein